MILASGIGAFTPRKLAAPTAAAFENKGLYYYARSFDDFAGKRVVVVGGGDSAVDYALALAPRAAALSVVHRSQFRAVPNSVEQLRATNATLYQPDHEIKEVHGDSLRGGRHDPAHEDESRHHARMRRGAVRARLRVGPEAK